MITSAKYNQNGTISATISGQEMTIPDEMSNRHRQMISEWEAEGNTIEPWVQPLPTNGDVNSERARRLELGTVVSVTGYATPIYVQGRDEDTRNLQGLATAAFARMSQGDTTTITTFRDGYNDMHDLTPSQVWELWSISSNYVKELYAASWAIKEMVPMPADITADALWPANGV